MNPALSVLIATRDRKELLARCLSALAEQRVPAASGAFGGCEVLVSDDGSSDGTAELIAGLRPGYPWPLRYHAQPNRGPAAARNWGLGEATGRIILMLGDDIIPASRDFLQEHLRWHDERFPEPETAVLGRTAWSTELEITPFMRWLEDSGIQFDYRGLRQGDMAGHKRFYTSNISVKKAFLRDDRFDERFPYPVLEDLEFGYRLERRGLRIAFNPRARALHLHPVTLDGYCRRAELTGASAATYYRLHPELEDRSWLRRLQGLALRVLFNDAAMPFWLRAAKFFEKRLAFHYLFLAVYARYFCKGLAAARESAQRSP
ncbi:MAG: glycosyltransferase family 2 protein [Elusimicrobia bacterium]|nr:glycosyltransferase family 2 protein [Elusimicrobiota bacterium]